MEFVTTAASGVILYAGPMEDTPPGEIEGCRGGVERRGYGIERESK